MMKTYEGMFIIRPDKTLEGADGALVLLQEAISKNGGTIESSQDWGKRRLSYKIGNCQEGIYWSANFRMAPDGVAKLKQMLKLNEALLRMLIIKK